MRRTLLPLLTGLGLSLAVVACGDDSSSSNCGPGTHSENGVCVVDPPQDTFTGTDAFNQPDSTVTPTDTLPGNDTGGVATDTFTETDTFNPNVCEPTEASVRDVGAGCSKSCQCRQDIGLSCMTFDYYLPGFYFCTKIGDGTLSSNDGYQTLKFASQCYGGTPQSTRPEVYQKQCTNLAFCKALSNQYTHCGTDAFPWISGGSHTQCPQNDGGGSPGTLHTQPTCIIETLEPFVP